MKKLLMIAACLLSLSSCYNDKADKLYPMPPVAANPCDTTGTVKYSTDIKPIILANCAISGGCHDAAGASTSGFDYSGSASALIGNVAGGVLLGDINWAPTRGHNNMPKNLPKLSDCDINKITAWVNQGAHDN